MSPRAPQRVLAVVSALALAVAGTLVASPAPAHAAVTLDPVPLAPAAGSYVSDWTPRFSWEHGSGQYLFSHAVQVKDSNGTVRGSIVQFTSPWVPIIPLADGAYTWQVRGQDLQGAGAWSTPVPFVIDTRAPDLALTAPAAGTFGGGEVTVTGTVSDANPGTVSLTDNGVVIATDTSGGSTFSFTFTPTTGTHSLVVTAVDKAGNSDSGSTASVVLSIDADAPSIALLSPSDGSFVKPGTVLDFHATASDANEFTWEAQLDGAVIDSGAALAGVGVDRHGAVDTSAWADASSHVFAFSATDEFGQSNSANATVTADASAPEVTFASPTRLTAVNGNVTVAGTAADATSGLASLTLRVRPHNPANNTCLASVQDIPVTVATDGGWSVELDTTAFADGGYCLTALAIDNVGNATGSSRQIKHVTFDNSAPAGTLTGTFPNGWHMSVDHLAWTSLTDPNGVTYEVALGGHPNVDGAGLMTQLDWVVPGLTTNSYAVDIPTGPHFYQVRAVDDLGNATPWTAPRGFQVIGVPEIVSPTDGELFSASSITAEWTPVYGVGGVDRYEIEYGLDRDHDGVLSPEYRTVTGTGWNGGANVTRVQSFPAEAGLPTGYEGPLSIRVRAVYKVAYPNAAGSVYGPWSAPVVNYVRDTGDPTLTVVTPIDGAVLSDDDDIPVTLEASDPAGITRLVANLHANGSFLKAIGSTTPGGALGTTATRTWNIPAGLAEGDYEIRASARDSADKVTRVSVSFTIDATAPVVTFTSPTSNSSHAGVVPVTGTVTDGVAGVASLRIIVREFETSTGLCSGASQSFTVPFGTDGAWSLDLDTSVFADGVYCIIGHAEDLAGNGNGQSTRLRDVTFDNTGPDAPQPINPENGRTQANDSPLLDWLPVSDAVSYEVRTSTSPARTPNVNDGELSGGDAATVPAADSELQLSGLPQGRLFWQVRGIDALGNEGPWSNIWSLGVDTVAPTVSLVSPADGAVLSSGNFTIDWTNGEAGSTYELRTSSDPTVDGDGRLVGGGSATLTTSEYAVAGASETTHYWQVRATDAAGNVGPWTPVWSLTVDLPTLSVPPPAGTPGTGGAPGTDGAGEGEGEQLESLTTLPFDQAADETNEDETNESDETESEDGPAAAPASSTTGVDAGMIALLVGIVAALLLFLFMLLAWLRRRNAEA